MKMLVCDVAISLVVLCGCGLEIRAAQVLATDRDAPLSHGRDDVHFLRAAAEGTNDDLADLKIHLKSTGRQGKGWADGIKDALGLEKAEKADLPLVNNASREVPHYLKCGSTHKAGSSHDKYEQCPNECPYFAKNLRDPDFCTFVCVPAEDCAMWNEEQPIPGRFADSNTCRGPVVQFCQELNLDGTDTCSKCQLGWTVWPEDGQCYFTYWRLIYGSGLLLLILILALVVYVTEWCRRPTINPDGVRQGEAFRSQCKILVPKDKLHLIFPGEDKHQRCPYPSTTNLCTEDVAGPGMLLHFNFQAFMIAWPLCVALLWTFMACFHNELFKIGTRRFGTPRHNCILVAWGHETQERLMWTKVLFLTLVYLGTFVGLILFAVRQYRIYQEMDAMEKTMKDFVVEIEGLPPALGAASVESDIKKALEEAGCTSIIGVSVCWDYGKLEDRVMNEVGADQVDKELELSILSAAQASARSRGRPKRNRVELRQVDEKETEIKVGDIVETLPPEDMGPYRKFVYMKEMALLGPSRDPDDPKSPYGPDPVTENTVEEPDKTRDFLMTQVTASSNAFVVFDTQEAREAALEASVLEKLVTQPYEIAGTTYTNNPLKLAYINCQPTTVNWHNFGDSSILFMIKRFCIGFFGVYIPALSVWFFAFYVPYAYSLYYFNYANGAELPEYYGLLFTIVVVAGNTTMYFVCDLVGDIIGFRYKDTKQVAYMLMYLVACTLNVLLDMVVTYSVAYRSMVGLGFRDYHGKHISEYTSFTETFETYAMQRSLAENVKLYSFPSTFLVPFLIEPIVTVILPYHLGRLIVRTHKEIQGRCAEAYYEPFEFDLGRYADILLNAFLGILIFWFPGGYINLLFYGMAGSHLWIYCFDHYKVLHAIPAVRIVSREVDAWSQLVLAALNGMILSSLVFKANCEPYWDMGYCLQGSDLVVTSALAGVAHFVVHLIVLFTLVPALGFKKEQLEQIAKAFENQGKRFEEVAEYEPYTWFTTNPVHCLRSIYVHNDSPYCRYASVGKEHLLEVNPKINCYFKDMKGEVEVFDEVSLAKAFFEMARHFLSRAWIFRADKKNDADTEGSGR